MTVSPQIKIVALIGIIAAVGVFLFMQVMGHGSSSPSTAATTIKPLHPVKVHITTLRPTTRPAAAKTTKTTVVKRPTHTAVVHKTTVHKVVAPRAKGAVVAAPAVVVAANGLPVRVNQALLQFPVVVVSLYNPQASIDSTSLDEAAAGAKMAKAGFLAINVLDQAQASPFTDALGVLQDPTLLIYARPGKLMFRVDGFADRQVIAQAALSSKRTL